MFKIYTKSKKIVFTRALISFSLFTVIIIFSLFFEKVLNTKILRNIFSYCLFLLFIFGIINSFFNRQLKGKLDGYIIFDPEYIKIENEIYAIQDINSVKFSLKNYKREYIGSSNPAIFLENFSNGVNNLVTIELNNGEIIQCYFQREKENEIMSIHKSLRSYLDNRKLSRKNYDEITR